MKTEEKKTLEDIPKDKRRKLIRLARVFGHPEPVPTPPKVEVTEEKLRTAWKNHVTGKAIPNYLAFKKELGL